MRNISEFIEKLETQKNTSTVSNPYLVKGVSNNLRAYLEVMFETKGDRVLLVGEAPGHRGCKVTGIPFTSGKVFENVDHPVLKKLKSKIKLEKIESENTATIVWNYLSTKENTPLFWNSYPYHPHPVGNEEKNRVPNQEEIEFGVQFLKGLSSLYNPVVIAGIGYAGVECAKRAFPKNEITYIRHPSFGGKSDFIEGMNKII